MFHRRVPPVFELKMLKCLNPCVASVFQNDATISSNSAQQHPKLHQQCLPSGVECTSIDECMWKHIEECLASSVW